MKEMKMKWFVRISKIGGRVQEDIEFAHEHEAIDFAAEMSGICYLLNFTVYSF